MASALATVLAAAKSGEDATRNAAESQLKSFRESYPDQYFLGLAAELKNEATDPFVRQMAGIQLKNAIDATDPGIREFNARRWRQLPEAVKESVKQDVLSCLLVSCEEARKAAAQAVAALGVLEMMQRSWPTLITQLVGYAGTAGVPPENKVSTIKALGYLCEELLVGYISDAEVQGIMSLMIANMAAGQPDPVRVAAAVALKHTLDFATLVFNDDSLRGVVMENIAVLAADKTATATAREAAFDCINRVAELYYAKLHAHIDRLARLTFEAMAEPSEKIIVCAVEFWNTIAETEYEFDPEEQSQNRSYASQVAEQLLPQLIQLMCRITEDASDDTYTAAQAGTNCLTALGRILGNNALNTTLPWIQANMMNADWHVRDAVVMTLGVLLQGCTGDFATSVVTAVLPQLLARLVRSSGQQEPKAAVRDSIAWVIGSIIDAHAVAMDLKSSMGALIGAFVEALGDESRVASKVAAAIVNIAVVMEGDEETFLSPYFLHLVDNLLKRASKDDFDENSLRDNCFEAINALIEQSAAKDEAHLVAILQDAMARLTRTLTTVAKNADEKQELETMQVAVTGTIQTLADKMDEGVVKPVAPTLVQILMHVLDSSAAVAQEEAYRALTKLASCLGSEFAQFLEPIMARVLRAASDLEHEGLCDAAIHCGGEVCRSVGPAVQPYVQHFVATLVAGLKDVRMARRVRPTAIAAFGDVAVLLGPAIGALLPQFINLVQEAAGTKIDDSNDEDLMDYKYALRKAVLDAWTAIVQGFMPDNDATPDVKATMRSNAVARIGTLLTDILQKVQPFIVDECRKFAEDDDVHDKILLSAVGLLYDIATTVGKEPLRTLLTKTTPWVATALDVADKLEIASWDGDDHDEDGRRRKTVAALARGALP